MASNNWETLKGSLCWKSSDDRDAVGKYLINSKSKKSLENPLENYGELAFLILMLISVVISTL